MAFRSLKNKIKGLNGSEASSRGSSKERDSANGSHTPDSAINNPKYRPHDEIVAERLRRSVDKSRRRSNSRNRQSMTKRRDQVFLEDGPEELTKLYKPLSMNMSKNRKYDERFDFKDLDIES